MQTFRLFWFGAHKVLKRTELRDLRAMGIEVFNPAYITPVYDQSADMRVDTDQPTTLPADVLTELLAHNFFYNEITPRIFDLLNEYFAATLVTINADWLKALLAGYNGQVIYRIYGQHFSLSEKLVEIGLWRTMIERPNITIMPFAEDSVANEHRWFLDLCKHIVPYQIPDDVFARTGTWSNTAHRREIATSIPNIQNPYFAAAYVEFNGRFPHRLFRIYGPQRSIPGDSRIMGALERDVLLDRFAGSAGFLYDFKDAVCYLPPIETMQIGGPVIYAPGSLLSRMYRSSTPGLMVDQADAEKKMLYLLDADRGFLDEVIDAQDCVRQRYDRAIVRPIFEQAFRDLLLSPRNQVPASSSISIAEIVEPTARLTFVILLHADGWFVHSKGKAYAFEGIPRVIDVFVNALIRFSSLQIELTCTVGSQPALADFFRSAIRSGRLSLRPVDCGGSTWPADAYENRLHAVAALNAMPHVACVLVPHYYLFPEALLLTAPTMLYLPDYFPFLMPGVVFDTSVEKDTENREVGIAIANRAVALLTNSAFTATYLSDAGFVPSHTTLDKGKVCIAPLPLLGEGRTDPLSVQEEQALRHRVAGRRFILYPTANRPNKQLAFLLQVFAVLRLTQPDLMLVLTCSLSSVPGVAEAFMRYGLGNHVLLMPGTDEGSLRWLYENAAALCLTSTLEGNFPPQVREALEYGAPIVATRLTPIIEALGETADDLLLCSPLSLDDFRDKLLYALTNRAQVIANQERAMHFLKNSISLEQFYGVLANILDPLTRQTAELAGCKEHA